MLSSLIKVALLIIAVLGIAGGSRSAAAAEDGVVAPGDSQASAVETRLDQEARQHANDLKSKGFAFDSALTTSGPMYFSLSVDQPSDENEISLWLETAQGRFAVKLWDPEGQLVVSWRGQRGDHRDQVLKRGSYLIAVQGIDGARVHGAIGIKGPKSGGRYCKSYREELQGELTEHRADRAHGYSWPFLLFIPPPPSAGAPSRLGGDRLLIVPNNNGSALSEDVEFLRAAAICEVTNGGDIDARELAGRLGTPVLVPLFPRPRRGATDIELQALTRASLTERERRFARVDLQLIAMIKAARAILAHMGRPVRSRVLIAGFSAAGSFANRFAVLHPKLVLAAAVGSPGGWPIAPVGIYHGAKLRYPIGISDVGLLTGRAVDLKELRRVSFLFFLGDADTNDSVACRDTFSAPDAELINHLFGECGLTCGVPGERVAKRWPTAERLYQAVGMKHATFMPPYPNVEHQVSSKMRDDIIETFRRALAAHNP